MTKNDFNYFEAYDYVNVQGLQTCKYFLFWFLIRVLPSPSVECTSHTHMRDERRKMGILDEGVF